MNWVREIRKPISEHEAIAQKGAFRRSPLDALVFFLPILRPHAARVALVCMLDVLIILLTFIPPWYGTFLVDQAFAQRDWGYAFRLMGLLLLTWVFIQTVQIMRNVVFAALELRVKLELRNRMVEHLQRLSILFTESSPVGVRVFRIRIDSDAVATVMANFFPTLTRFLELFLIILAVAALDPVVTLIALVFVIPWTYFSIRITNRYREFERQRLRLAEHRDAGVLQGVSSFQLLKSFARQRWELRRHAHRSAETQRVAIHHWLTWYWFDMAVLRLIPYLRSASVAVYFGWNIIHGRFTLGATLPMIAYLDRLTDIKGVPPASPIGRIVQFINDLRLAMVPAERCMQILQVQTSVPEPEKPERLRRVVGDIAFEGVRFGHPGYSELLHGVDLRLEPGKTTAVVGPSGAGKSTLAALALRLYDPSGGRVTLDGVDLRRMLSHEFQRRMAVVSQDTFVFGGTLRENLLYGNPRADDAAMWDALERVELADWARGLGAGLDQELDSGSALSAGQRQRLGIARALLAEPSVLILDEPTSALDAETEKAVLDTLRRASAGITTLFVTHRLNTILDADKVAVLEGGVIAEEGTPAELLERPDSRFRAMMSAFRGAA